MLGHPVPGAPTFEAYDLSRNAYGNNDVRVKMLYSTTAYMLCFDDCRARSVLVQTYVSELEISL